MEASHFWIEVFPMTMRVSPPPAPTLQTVQRGTPHPHRRAIAIALAGLGLLALSAAALPSTAASAPASAPIGAAVAEPVAVSLSVPTDQRTAGLGCWVTGDMIWSPEGTARGDPAEMARAVCGGR
jgi:hypothetical protein